MGRSSTRCAWCLPLVAVAGIGVVWAEVEPGLSSAQAPATIALGGLAISGCHSTPGAVAENTRLKKGAPSVEAPAVVLVG